MNNKTFLHEFLVAFGIGLFAFIQTFSFNSPIALYRYGANRWPATIAIIMMTCAALLFWYRRFYSHPQEPEKSASSSDENSSWKHRILTFCVPILFVFSLPYIGFYAAVLIALPVHAWCLGQRNILKNLLITFPIGCCIIIVFTKYLFVPFPVGTLPGFYDFNSALVALMY